MKLLFLHGCCCVLFKKKKERFFFFFCDELVDYLVKKKRKKKKKTGKSQCCCFVAIVVVDLFLITLRTADDGTRAYARPALNYLDVAEAMVFRTNNNCSACSLCLRA